MSFAKRIGILVWSLEMGGAEKQSLELSIGLMKYDYDVVLLRVSANTDDFFEIPTPLTTEIICKDLPRPLNRFGGRCSKIISVLCFLSKSQRIIESFDSVIIFGSGLGVLTTLSNFRHRHRFIVSERINPNPKVYKPSLLARIGRPLIYRLGVICSVQTLKFQEWVSLNWGVNSFLTPNVYEVPHHNVSVVKPAICEERYFLAASRNSPQKNLFELIQVWQQYKLMHFDSRTKLIIATQLDKVLLTYLKNCECPDLIVIPPQKQEDLFSLMRRAIAFISVSHFEGFPNTVAEALMLGAPVITTPSSDVLDLWASKGLCVLLDEPISKSLPDTLFEFDYSNLAAPRPRGSEELTFYSFRVAGRYWRDLIAYRNATSR